MWWPTLLNDECGRMNMYIPDEECEGQQILSPEVRNRLSIIGEVVDRQVLWTHKFTCFKVSSSLYT